MIENSKLSDDQLEGVSGGDGKTAGGYPYDKNGTVTFTDPQGNSVKIGAADWKWLLSQYGPVNPDAYVKDVPANDIKRILEDHHRK